MNHKVNILMLGTKGVGRKMLLKDKANDFILPTQIISEQELEALPPLQALVVVVDIPSLIDAEKARETIQTLAPQIKLIKQRFKKIHIQLIVTKCDLILGFRDFFNNLNAEERQRILGFKQTEANTLLKQINSRVISRLHQETIPEKRSIIQLFPSQLEKAIEYITEFSRSIHEQSGAHFTHTYFISSKQKSKSIDLIGNHKTTLPPTITEKPFFVEQMLAEIQEQAAHSALTAKRFDKKRWIVLPICIIVLVTLITTWHYSYKHTAEVLTKIEQSITQKHAHTTGPTWLARLNLLSSSIEKLNDPSLKYSRLVGFSQTATLKKKLTQLYHTELHTEFLPYIEGILSETMINGMQHDKLSLYNSLKIYLMLTTPNHYDEKTITNWFQTYWQHKYKDNQQQQQVLLKHLKNLLTLQNKDWPRNQPLINKAQQSLQQLPTADIIFLELQGNYKNQQQSLATMIQNSTNLDLSKAVIPSLYSSNNFKKIYNQQIPLLVSTFSQGDWVIGKSTTQTDNNSDQQSTLTSDVRALYLQYFSESWQNVLTTIKLKQPTNFADVQSLINELTNPQSSLMDLLEFASGNAGLNKQLQPNDALNLVNQFIHHKAVYTQSKTVLQQLSAYLKAIVSSDDINKASFNTTIAILNNQQPHNPIVTLRTMKQGDPIQNWLNTIANGTWKILLANSRAQLNTIWSSTVLPTYESKINGRYPFDSTSKDDITLGDFDSFMGPDGTIDVFFNYYLKPFVDMDSNYWTWKKVYGQQIAIPQSILDTFMRASLIQQMFYTDDNHKISFKFSLTPFTKSSDIRLITLNIEGQIQQFSKLNRSSSIIAWPGPVSSQVSINALFYKSKAITQSFNGPWALFRLLQSAKLTPLGNPQKYVLQFKLGNGLAAYHLIADNRINPLIPDVLDKFSCPQNL